MDKQEILISCMVFGMLFIILIYIIIITAIGIIEQPKIEERCIKAGYDGGIGRDIFHKSRCYNISVEEKIASGDYDVHK